MGMAFSKAVAAGAATREGKVMTVAGLASLGAFGCVSPQQCNCTRVALIRTSSERSVTCGIAWPCSLSVQDMAGPTAYTK